MTTGSEAKVRMLPATADVKPDSEHTTAEAADLLGLSERGFRNLHLKPSGRRGRFKLYSGQVLTAELARRSAAQGPFASYRAARASATHSGPCRWVDDRGVSRPMSQHPNMRSAEGVIKEVCAALHFSDPVGVAPYLVIYMPWLDPARLALDVAAEIGFHEPRQHLLQVDERLGFVPGNVVWAPYWDRRQRRPNGRWICYELPLPDEAGRRELMWEQQAAVRGQVMCECLPTYECDWHQAARRAGDPGPYHADDPAESSYRDTGGDVPQSEGSAAVFVSCPVVTWPVGTPGGIGHLRLENRPVRRVRVERPPSDIYNGPSPYDAAIEACFQRVADRHFRESVGSIEF